MNLQLTNQLHIHVVYYMYHSVKAHVHVENMYSIVLECQTHITYMIRLVYMYTLAASLVGFITPVGSFILC